MHKCIIGSAVIMVLTISQVLFSFPFSVSEVKETKAAGTIFIDNQLASNCTSGNYSVASRNCTGSNGNAYSNIQAALSSSTVGDTINIRTGTYISNVTSTEGIIVKSGQTWQTYPGDSTRATIQAGISHVQVLKVDFVDNVTLQNLLVRGGTHRGVFVGSSKSPRIINLDVSGYNTSSSEYRDGIDVLDCCGAVSTNGYIADNYVHDQGSGQVLSAGIAVLGSTSNFVVERNRVQNAGMGIWLDVNSGNPDSWAYSSYDPR
jgi:parallel beta-helix repeat protein